MLVHIFGVENRQSAVVHEVPHPIPAIVRLGDIICTPWGLWENKHKPLAASWYIENAPISWSSIGFGHNDSIYTDRGQYVVIRQLRWFYNGQLIVSAAPDLAVYLLSCVGEFWKSGLYQNDVRYMIYPARWAVLGQEHVYKGYFVDVTYFGESPQWYESNELLVSAKVLKSLMEGATKVQLAAQLQDELSTLEELAEDTNDETPVGCLNWVI